MALESEGMETRKLYRVIAEELGECNELYVVCKTNEGVYISLAIANGETDETIEQISRKYGHMNVVEFEYPRQYCLEVIVKNNLNAIMFDNVNDPAFFDEFDFDIAIDDNPQSILRKYLVNRVDLNEVYKGNIMCGEDTWCPHMIKDLRTYKYALKELIAIVSEPDEYTMKQLAYYQMQLAILEQLETKTRLVFECEYDGGLGHVGIVTLFVYEGEKIELPKWLDLESEGK